ncbi:hypothetical protein DWB79_10505 [Treponema medium]|uniref:Uncharacterized protein n=2 Tax=Treponema medium TaxID=58231 RepID=A0AA87NT50_TREMD|nr:hypothetical protein [Treponema medium]EPF27941.1 hypothetical protein HMPREF9195_02072 [Treponema medium ATCC 700293]QSH98172.1 hypothetical protein DWB79_10505 [Treponema medium]
MNLTTPALYTSIVLSSNRTTTDVFGFLVLFPLACSQLLTPNAATSTSTVTAYLKNLPFISLMFRFIITLL